MSLPSLTGLTSLIIDTLSIGTINLIDIVATSVTATTGTFTNLIISGSTSLGSIITNYIKSNTNQSLKLEADGTGELVLNQGGTDVIFLKNDNVLYTGELKLNSTVSKTSSSGVEIVGDIFFSSATPSIWMVGETDLSSTHLRLQCLSDESVLDLANTNRLFKIRFLNDTNNIARYFTFKNGAGSTAYLGVGDFDPTYNLDVSGDCNITGVYRINGVNILSNTSLASSVVNSSLTSVGILNAIDLISGQAYKINGVNILSNTSLASSVVNSSLTSVGILNAIDLISGQAYKINGVNILSETSLASSVVNSSLTSVGILNAIDLISGQAYKINGVNILSNTSLASSVVNSSLTSVGILNAIDLISGQAYKINGVNILSETSLASSVVNSSLTSVGILNAIDLISGQAYKINGVNILSNTSLASSVVNSYFENIIPASGGLYIGNSASTHIQIGSTASYIDFVSFSGADYNGRIIGTGGTTTSASGTLTYKASNHVFENGKITCTQVVDNAFLHQISTSQIYTKSFTALNSALSNGQSVQLSLGKAQSLNNCVEISHAYDGSTPANNKIAFGFYGNNLMTINQLGTIQAGSFILKSNTKNNTTLSNSTQISNPQTNVVLANITFTSNSQASYVCSASSNNSTAYQAFGTSANNWFSTSVYNPSGVYTGAISTISNLGVTTTGEYVQIQLPSATYITGASWTNTQDSNGSRTAQYYVFVSTTGNSGTWVLIASGNNAGATTTTITTSTTIYPASGKFNYFRLQINSITAGGTGFNGEAEIDGLTINSYSNPTELTYLPQSVEIGQSNNNSLPTDSLTVNGLSRFKGEITGENHLNLSGTGYLYNYKKIYAKITTTATGGFTANTSFWDSSRSPTVVFDTTSAISGVTGYGLQTSGTYNGMYRAYYSGIYQVHLIIRFGDLASVAVTGFIPKTYNGTTYTNILLTDGVIWVGKDDGNRRIASTSFFVQLNSGTAVFCTVYSSTTQTSAEMYVEFLSSI